MALHFKRGGWTLVDIHIRSCKPQCKKYWITQLEIIGCWCWSRHYQTRPNSGNCPVYGEVTNSNSWNLFGNPTRMDCIDYISLTITVIVGHFNLIFCFSDQFSCILGSVGWQKLLIIACHKVLTAFIWQEIACILLFHCNTGVGKFGLTTTVTTCTKTAK